MNTEGEYKTSKYLSLHRWGSLILAMIGLGISLSDINGIRSARFFASFIFPLAMIWFAEQLSSWAIKDSGGWLNASNADTAVRFFGWLILLIMLGFRAMIHFSV